MSLKRDFFKQSDIIFKSRLRLILFLNIFLCVVCHSKTEELLKNSIPVSYNQNKAYAEAVCGDLFQDRASVSTCRNRFLTSRNTTNNIEVDIRCQTEIMVLVAVPPSREFKLVILVSSSNDEADTDIIYSLIDPDKVYGTVYPPPGNYTSTFWSTTLNQDGVPSRWRRGPTVNPWEIVQKTIPHKDYDIEINFLFDKYINETYYIDSTLTWNTSGSYDSCFNVINSCNKDTQGNHFDKNIKPHQHHSAEVPHLPLDDKCTVTVTGIHGFNKKEYRTPACRDVVGCALKPEVAENVSVEAVERGDAWSVRVCWTKPRDQPLDYNITLAADDERSVIIPGNATEVLFEDVSGEGNFEVLVLVRGVYGTSTTVAEGSFNHKFSQRSPGGAAGALGGAALLAATALLAAALYWRRRSRDQNHYYAQGVLAKIAEEGDMNTGPESGSEDTWEVRPERLLLHEVVGEGAFGVVRRGTMAPGDKDVAVKMLKEYPTTEEVRSFRSEMELMKSVGAHAHVVSLLGCCSGRRPLIVAEYCARGDLLSYLRCSWDMMISRRNAKYYNNNKENYRNDLFKSKPSDKFVANRLYDIQGVCDAELTMLDLLSFCRQIAMGMEFLASNRVVHRDLAARNVLVTGDRTLKIADFGLSRDVYQENQYKQKGNGKMPVKWMALESLTHRIYTTQSDVWSFGVVVWEVVTVGGAPYTGVGAARLPRLLAAGYRMPRPHNCGPALYELMLSCWRGRARCRPTFSELVVRLDALLCASADHYLSLALPLPDDAPDPPAAAYRYIRMLLSGKRGRGKSYERPFAPTNHYTEQPAAAPACAPAPACASAPASAPPYSTHTHSPPACYISKGT